MSIVSQLADAVVAELAAPTPLPPPPKAKRPKPAQLALLLSADEVAQLLGVSAATVWRMASSGKLPRQLKIGTGLTRWRRSDIERQVQLSSEAGRWIGRRELDSLTDA